MRGKESVPVVISAQQDGASLLYTHWLKKDNEWGITGGIVRLSLENPNLPAIMTHAGGGHAMLSNVIAEYQLASGLVADIRDAQKKLGYHAKVLLQFLEILSCKNVEIGDAERKRVKKGQRLSALPSRLTKVLQIKQTEPTGGLRDTVADRRTPREHLRRGHIHRFKTKTGYVRHWVNAMIVNPGVGGKIDKSYAVS